jgi:uncharacterized protein (DUF1330 family)
MNELANDSMSQRPREARERGSAEGAYAVAHLRTVDQNAEILDYLLRIDATLDPFGGRFLVHGTLPEVLEGHWPGVLVVIAFPDLDAARAWYHSPAYQEILPLRTRNADGYRAARFAEKLAAG